jgi:DNA polymerase-3 subunit delta'
MAFKDIVGHKDVIELLKTGLLSNRIPASPLFAGPDGVGKAFVSRVFIKALYCKDSLADSCDTCISCKKIDDGNHPDVMWVYPEGKGEEIKIDGIRNLTEKMYLKPFESDKKVFVIVDADNMREPAANALLKTLEEPASDSFIILITSIPERLPETIISRCQKINFRFISSFVICDNLQKKLGTNKRTAEIVSSMCDGRYGLAVRLIRSDTAQFRTQIIKSLQNPNPSFVGILFDQSRDVILDRLQLGCMWFRDILVYKLTQSKEHLIYPDCEAQVSAQSKYFSINRIQNVIDSFISARSKIESRVDATLVLENLLMQLV